MSSLIFESGRVTVTTGADDALVNLIVTNFSGGKRHSGKGGISADAAASDAQIDPLEGVAQLTDTVRPEGGFALAIQEMTTDDPGLPTRALGLEQALGGGARSSFVPRVSTSWYPLREKWGEKIDPGGAHSEGLCVVGNEYGLTLAPWSSVLSGPEPVESFTRVVDLPNFGFPATEAGDSGLGWLEAQVGGAGGTIETVKFRSTFYRGNRDSDPRVAQACLLAWSDAGSQGRDEPACVIVNVHLSTLSTEREAGVRGRKRSPEASFLRSAQLDVIARYVNEVRRVHRLPVIIAGDFNAEPGSPEMKLFAREIGSPPLLTADRCWKCGSLQKERPEVTFYAEHGLDYTLEEAPNRKQVARTRAVCSNEMCLEPRFTHKGNLLLLDNVFALPAVEHSTWNIVPGRPRVDVRWGYSDHAAIIVPFGVSKFGLWPEEDRI